MKTQILEALGLSKGAALVYVALLQSGQVKGGAIIIATKLSRSVVYQALEELESEGLVAKTIVRGVARYTAQPPARIVERADRLKLQAAAVAKELSALNKTPAPVATIHRGSGVVGDYLNVHRGADVLGVPTSEALVSLLKAGSRILTNIDPASHRNVKAAPFSLPPQLLQIFSKEAIALAVLGDEPTVIEIKDKILAKAQQDYFDQLWGQGMSVRTGWAAMTESFTTMLNTLSKGDHYFTLGTNLGDYKGPLRTFFLEYNQARIVKGISVNVLCYKGAYKTLYEAFQRAGDTRGEYSKVRILPIAGSVPLQVNMYRDRAVLILQHHEQPTVITIDNAEIAQGFKGYFDALWQFSE